MRMVARNEVAVWEEGEVVMGAKAMLQLVNSC